MTKEDLKKAWLAGALVCGAIISAIFLYAVVVELAPRFTAFRPPLTGPAAAAVKYACYILGASAVFSLKFIRPALEAKKGTARDAVTALVKQAALTASLCEVPAFSGLALFFLTGGYWDFYLLAAFSTVMELVFFPRYQAWEDRIRNVHGLNLE